MIDGGSHLKSASKLSNQWGPPLDNELRLDTKLGVINGQISDDVGHSDATGLTHHRQFKKIK
jgi:hypothetical protein